MLTFLVIFAVITRCFGVEGVDECIGTCSQTTENGTINYLPHNDCNKYCVCVAGRPEVMPCEPDQHWSPELEICTHPAEARCQGKSVALGCMSECPAYDILIRHRSCTKYCKCKNSQAKVKDCRAGFYFSTLNQKCGERKDSDCPKIPTRPPPTRPPPTRPPPTRPPPTRPPPTRPPPTRPPPTRPPPTRPPPTRPPPTRPPPTRPPPTRPPPTRPPPTRPPPTRPPPTDSKGCIGECPLCNSLDHTDHLPHTDEHKFCKCNWGKPIVFKCPDDLVYIEKDQVCGYPYGDCS